ncbi:MAG: MFS transporter [Gammaproteobacteria bacterium]|jgi:predicted MFS family arabinose efflux permease|nr:MFS transporter [Gammaproteobacteria bacterium]
MSDISALQNRNTNEPDVNNVWTVSSVVIGSGVALLALFTGPLLVSEYISKLAVSESQAGFIVSVELGGFTLGAAILFGIARLNWRRIMSVALLIMILGNLMCSLVDNLSTFILCRFVAGLGAGVVMTMTIQVIGIMRSPDRVYGMWTVGQLSLGALGMLVFPAVIALSSVNAVFLIWALLAAVLFISVRFYPQGRDAESSMTENLNSKGRRALGLLGLLGLFVYYGGQAGVWVYLERVGFSWGIEREQVVYTLFVSLLAGISGGVVAIVLGDRLGRALPLTASMIISAVSILAFIQLRGTTTFVVAACLFNFGWYLFLPYMSAIIAAVDNNGSLLTGLAVIFPAGLAAGPAIAALLIETAGTLTPALLYGLISVPVGLVLILPAARLRQT